MGKKSDQGRIHVFSKYNHYYFQLAYLTCSESVRPQDSEVVQGRVGNESHVTEAASAILWPRALYKIIPNLHHHSLILLVNSYRIQESNIPCTYFKLSVLQAFSFVKESKQTERSHA